MPFQPLHEPDAIHATLKPIRSAESKIKMLITSKDGGSPLGIVALSDFQDHGLNARIEIGPLAGYSLPEEAEAEAVRLMLTIAFEKHDLRNVYMKIPPSAAAERARLETIGFIYGATHQGSVIMDCINPEIWKGRE